MKILFIAPLPPPITGHSLASKILYDELSIHHQVKEIDLSKNSFKAGIDSLGRIIDVFKILFKTFIYFFKSDRIYLTISESFAGNLKDLLIYIICFSKLNKFYIHLHGGSLQTLLFNKNKVIYNLNKFFISRVGGVIVLGPSHVSTFSSFVPAEKIFIVPNFSEDYIFISEAEFSVKHKNTSKINLLFLSNMQVMKGFQVILDAFLQLDSDFRNLFNLDFAGKFESHKDEEKFIDRIKNNNNINYHGIVKGDSKRNLLKNAHVFILPTSFLEGQPVSILEAYASGCFVLTTTNGGVIDIFVNNINGYEIEQSIKSIKENLIKLANNLPLLKQVGRTNRNEAFKKYRTSIYNKRILDIIES